MTDVLGVASRVSSDAAVPATTSPRMAARAIALTALAVTVAAALAISTILRPSAAPAGNPANDAGRAHVLWLRDEHASGSIVIAPAAAHQLWIRGEHASYATTRAGEGGSDWQTYRTFRLEEEGYGE
jgi:hypothetical protein